MKLANEGLVREDELQFGKMMECASKIKDQVWVIGNRRFNDDWRMRVGIFDLHERFVRSVMDMHFWSYLGYWLREKLGREKMVHVVRQLMRAWRLEEMLRRGDRSKIVQACFREIRSIETRGL